MRRAAVKRGRCGALTIWREYSSRANSAKHHTGETRGKSGSERPYIAKNRGRRIKCPNYDRYTYSVRVGLFLGKVDAEARKMKLTAKRADQTVADFSRKIGLSSSTLQRIETMQQNVSIDTLQHIINRFPMQGIGYFSRLRPLDPRLLAQSMMARFQFRLDAICFTVTAGALPPCILLRQG